MSAFRLAAAVFVAFMIQAQPPGTREARAAYDQGMDALRSGDRAAATALFRKAIDADSRFLPAHEKFIEMQEDAGPDLEAIYQGWAAAHPGNPVYEWGLARIAGTNWRVSEAHLRRALAIDPSFAPAYADLALVAELRGDTRAQVDYLRQASDLDPSSDRYFFSYANAMRRVDTAVSIRLLQQVADRFPGTDTGAQGLYWAAAGNTDVTARLAAFERLRKEFPPEKYSWSESGMADYFDLLVGVDLARARALASDMESRIRASSERTIWRECAAYAAALAESADLRAKGDGKAAVRRLADVKLPRRSLDPGPLAIARAGALDAAGDRAEAYSSLAEVALSSPSDAVLAELTRIGTALDMAPGKVHADLRQRRDRGAKPAPPFTLPAYPDGAKVSLADYKGRVVVLAFWYPSCGPCRTELPILQRVLDKYRDRVAVLAVNVLPEEKDLAISYLTKNLFGFRALETTGEWAEATYGVSGVPATFLVDRNGRIALQPVLIPTARYQRMLELQIESLL